MTAASPVPVDTAEPADTTGQPEQNSTLHANVSSPEPNPSTPTADDKEEPSFDSLAPTWQTAAACGVEPNRTNSVQDAMGRLWGFNVAQDQPCAYRADDGTSLVYAGYIKASVHGCDSSLPATAGALPVPCVTMLLLLCTPHATKVTLPGLLLPTIYLLPLPHITPTFPAWPPVAPLMQVKWETAPACTAAPTSTNSMPDAQGRLWGWDAVEEDNCAFKNPSSGAPLYFASYNPEPVEDTAANVPVVSPSAAGELAGRAGHNVSFRQTRRGD